MLRYLLVVGGDWETWGDYSSICEETGKLGGPGWPLARRTLDDQAAKPGVGGSDLESL